MDNFQWILSWKSSILLLLISPFSLASEYLDSKMGNVRKNAAPDNALESIEKRILGLDVTHQADILAFVVI